MEFDWDEHNIFHISMHGVAREDVEHAMTTDPVFVRSEFRSGEERRSWLGLATTRRILFIVVTERSSRVRTVTAFYAGHALRDYYRSRKGESADGKAQDA
jgi:uncharacterized DUF497 family protein